MFMGRSVMLEESALGRASGNHRAAVARYVAGIDGLDEVS
jgi:hypothetical protein